MKNLSDYNNLRYQLIATAIFATIIPVILLLLIIYSILNGFFNTENEIEFSYIGVMFISSFLYSYVWLVIIWIINKRFGINSLNKYIYSVVIYNLIYALIFNDIDLQSHYSFYLFTFAGGILFFILGLKLFRTKISFYGMKSTYSLLLILNGTYGIIISVFTISNPNSAFLDSYFSLVLDLILILLSSGVDMLLLYRAYCDKIIRGLI